MTLHIFSIFCVQFFPQLRTLDTACLKRNPSICARPAVQVDKMTSAAAAASHSPPLHVLCQTGLALPSSGRTDSNSLSNRRQDADSSGGRGKRRKSNFPSTVVLHAHVSGDGIISFTSSLAVHARVLAVHFTCYSFKSQWLGPLITPSVIDMARMGRTKVVGSYTTCMDRV